MTFGLRVDDVGRWRCLRPTLQYPRLADAMAAFEEAAPDLGTQATITEYGDSSRIVRIVCVGRPENGQVVWDMPASPWDCSD